MTTFEQTLLRELDTLPKEHWPAVLAYVRYLKFGVLGADMENHAGTVLQTLRETGEPYSVAGKEAGDEGK
jgi:hypothetical protein